MLCHPKTVATSSKPLCFRKDLLTLNMPLFATQSQRRTHVDVSEAVVNYCLLHQRFMHLQGHMLVPWRVTKIWNQKMWYMWSSGEYYWEELSQTKVSFPQNQNFPRVSSGIPLLNKTDTRNKTRKTNTSHHWKLDQPKPFTNKKTSSLGLHHKKNQQQLHPWYQCKVIIPSFLVM